MPNLFRAQILILLCPLIITASARGQTDDILIRNLTPATGKWGNQGIAFEAFNSQEYIKFLVVNCTLEFEGADSPYKVENKFSAYLEPGVWLRLEPEVTVSGNYGKAILYLEFFDVVDTMDAILPGQELFDTSFAISVDMPESVKPWLKKAMAFPPRVDEHPYFDNQFVRVMYAMMAEGLSKYEIAEITGADTGYVQFNLNRMAGRQCLKHDGTGYTPAVPLISAEEAEEARRIVDSTAALLASVLSDNFANFPPVLDSLAKTSRFAADSNNVLGPGRILYRPYVLTSALILWNDLGARFIGSGRYLDPFTATDLCNATNPEYMYAVPPGQRYNGHHFFSYTREAGSERILFADHYPQIICEGNFPARPGVAARPVWRNHPDDRVEYYVLDFDVLRPFVNVLIADTDNIIATTLARLNETSARHGRGDSSVAYRYWFWNLLASATADLMVEREVFSRESPGNYVLGIQGGSR